MEQATQLPNQRNYSDDLLDLVLKNSKEITDFYCDIADDLSFEEKQHLESQLLWLYRRFTNPHKDWNDQIIRSSQALLNSIIRFRDLANANEKFVTYKTLVGYESVFPSAWDVEATDFESEQEYRNSQITSLTESVRDDNAAEWLETIERCARTQTNDAATFPSFGQFLILLSEQKPEIVLAYLRNPTGHIWKFLLPILIGCGKARTIQMQGTSWFVGSTKENILSRSHAFSSTRKNLTPIS